MPVSHLYRVVQDGAGNLIVGATVTLCDPVGLGPIPDQLWADPDFTMEMTNPFTVMGGVIDVYLDQARTVTISTTYGGETQLAEWIDILPGAEAILAATTPVEITNDAFDGAILQMASDSTAEWVTPETTSGAVVEVVPGANVSVDATDPQRPIVSASSAGGGMVLQGPWSGSRNYAIGDCVLDSNRLYSCLQAVNAPGVVPGQDPSHWQEIAAVHDSSGRLQASDPNGLTDLVTLNYFNGNAVRNPPASDLLNDLGAAGLRWRRLYAGSVVNIPTGITPAANTVTIDASKGDASITLGASNITSSQILNAVNGQLLRITWIQPVTPVSYAWPPNCLFSDGVGPVVLTGGYQLTVEFRYNGIAWVELNRSLSSPAGAHGIPSGGALGQVLAKQSAADYDAFWTSAGPGGGGGVNYRGAWAAGNAYVLGDLVIANNRSYLCTGANTVPSTSFLGSRGYASNSANAFNIALPAGCQVGDVGVLAISSGVSNPVLPSGWNQQAVLQPDSATSTAQATLVIGTKALIAGDISAGQVGVPAQTWVNGWSATLFVFRGVSGLDLQSMFGSGWNTTPPANPTGPGFIYSLVAGVYAASSPGNVIAQPSLSGLYSACGNYAALGTGYEPYSTGVPQPRTFTASPAAPPVASQVNWSVPVLAGPSPAFFVEIGAIHDAVGRLQAAEPSAVRPSDLVNIDYLRRAYQRVPTAAAAQDGASAAYPYSHLYAQAVVNAPNAQTLAGNGAVTIDANLGDAAILLRANATSSTITGGVLGQILRITVIQDGSGARTFVWPTSCRFADGGATGPANPAINSQITVTFRFDGTNWIELQRTAAGTATIPTGGSAGQTLTKRSGTDYDSGWASGSPTAPTLGQTDCNKCTGAGWYLVTSSTNSPVAGRSYYLLTMVDPTSVIVGTPTYTQFAMRATSTITAAGTEQWQRTGYNGNWSPWSRIGGAGTDGTANEIMGILANGLPGWTAGFAPIANSYGSTNWTPPNATALLTAYPDGASMMALSTAQAAAGGWPSGASAIVSTFKFPDAAPDAGTGWARAMQIWARNTSAAASQNYMMRTGWASGWLPWTSLVQPSEYATVVNLTINGVNVATRDITWPAGLFTAAPVVMTNPNNGSTTPWVSNASAITATGCTLGCRSVTGGNGGSTPMPIGVYARQTGSAT